ncbi:hypothetical protein CC86DRAFT_375735 [Ophiobolus disseminans]|uniref:Methyltransferase domain-containing protein n=1 Tax=Ophiobolus disseminans TaxID=1469910 RepID=A0A6A6ZBY9_9PLEO|nr:hypothetical protein CC86DRAFT_375735 [Ophiobolus disseminans]
MATPTSDSDGDGDVTVCPESIVELPALTERPVAYAGCCLALSVPLVAHLRSLLPPPPAFTLSIGCGFGLFEAHLLAPPQSAHVIGVEVEPSPNKYLPADNHRTVHGTRFLEPLAGEAATWLFVYPRRVGLVSEYMHEHGGGELEHIIWIGPLADWDDYRGCFSGWEVHTQCADEVGGRPWEFIAVARKVT